MSSRNSSYSTYNGAELAQLRTQAKQDSNGPRDPLLGQIRRISKADRHLTVKVSAVTLEEGVLTHSDLHKQVAGRPSSRAGLTLTTQTNPITRIHAWWHLYR